MSDRIFYVGSMRGRNFTGFVPAKFLMRNGAYVMDPAPGGSQKAYLYPDASDTNKTGGSIANPNNYLIVPANYSDEQARGFASSVAHTLNQVYPEDDIGTMGPHRVREQMITAFRQGGSQDIQRNPQWGIPDGAVVPAFVGSASNHLGYVTALAGLPLIYSQIGGGIANQINAGAQLWNKLRGRDWTPIDTSGEFGLSRQNDANISRGYLDGLAASKPPASFNDYGYAQPRAAPGQIGDGNGISPFAATLRGINPKEPELPEWPPQQNAPVRFLSSRFAELNEARRNGR